MLDHVGIQHHGQGQGGDDHDGHLNQGIYQHTADSRPKGGRGHHIPEVGQTHEFIDHGSAPVGAATRGDVLEEAGVNGIDDRDDEDHDEQDAEGGHESPTRAFGRRVALILGTPVLVLKRK